MQSDELFARSSAYSSRIPSNPFPVLMTCSTLGGVSDFGVIGIGLFTKPVLFEWRIRLIRAAPRDLLSAENVVQSNDRRPVEQNKCVRKQDEALYLLKSAEMLPSCQPRASACQEIPDALQSENPPIGRALEKKIRCEQQE